MDNFTEAEITAFCQEPQPSTSGTHLQYSVPNSDDEDETAAIWQLKADEEYEEPQPLMRGTHLQYSVPNSDDKAELADLWQLKADEEDEEPQPLMRGTRLQYSGPNSDDIAETADLWQLKADEEAEEPLTSGTLRLCNTSSSVRQEISKIQPAVSFNKLVDKKLKRLACQPTVNLDKSQRTAKNARSSQDTSTASILKTEENESLCGKPYFKDTDNIAVPDNEDTVLMAKLQMYEGWTVKDKSELNRILQKMSVDLKKKELNSNISQLQKIKKNKKAAKTDCNKQKQIAAMKKEICDLNKKPLRDLALPIHMEYDWDMVANKCNNKRSPQEYRDFWRLFLHPSINQNSWDKNERKNLKKIAYANELQNWDKIADQLGTGRPGYQCFVYFRTNMSNTIIHQKWSKEEEEHLKELVESHREGDNIPWAKIASFMGNKTRTQIYNKYHRLTEKRKGRFLPEEDAVILTCVKKFGTNFRQVMKYLPGRSMAQLHARYNVLFTGFKSKTSTVWTADEDKKLIQIMENQDSPMNYSSLTNHFPHKNRHHIRARYITLVNWMTKYPNTDISKAPRRCERYLKHGVASKDIKHAVEKLHKRLRSESQSRLKPATNSTKLTKDSPEEDIDAAIVAALIEEQIKAEEEEKSKTCDTEPPIQEEWNEPPTPTNIANLRKTLILLKAKLDKEKFQNSPASKLFPELLQDNQETRVQVKKTYSRDKKVEVFVSDEPDIWGNKTLESTKYVLPPNYSTITACKNLLDYSAEFKPSEDDPKLAVLAKNNPVMKEQLDLMTERFKVLFMWPMLLSDKNPPKTPAQQDLEKDPPPVKKTVSQPGDPVINENIDLPNKSTEKEEEDL